MTTTVAIHGEVTKARHCLSRALFRNPRTASKSDINSHILQIGERELELGNGVPQRTERLGTRPTKRGGPMQGGNLGGRPGWTRGASGWGTGEAVAL